MEHKRLNARGAFKAWGIGFHYEFDEQHKALDIIQARSLRPITYTHIGKPYSDQALSYAYFIDKAAQITALRMSNNTSCDLSDIVDYDKLIPF